MIHSQQGRDLARIPEWVESARIRCRSRARAERGHCSDESCAPTLKHQHRLWTLGLWNPATFHLSHAAVSGDHGIPVTRSSQVTRYRALVCADGTRTSKRVENTDQTTHRIKSICATRFVSSLVRPTAQGRCRCVHVEACAASSPGSVALECGAGP